MTISDIALKRPIGSIVLSLVIILMGAVGFNFLSVRLYPAIDPPIITVQTSYTGANGEIIESQITEPLEKAINGIEGVKSISSQSAIGSSNITVEFELGADLEKAANDVRDKVSQGMRSLPQDIDAPPIVTKADANGDPIIMLTVQSANMNAIELSDYAETVLQEKLQTIPGVSSVSIFGQQRPAMRLWFNPAKMAALNVTPGDVSTALQKENVEMPGGKIRGNATELTVKTFGRLLTEKDFNNLIIRQTDNQVIRLSDIGEAVLGPQNEESGGTINGNTGLNLAIIPLPGANTIQISDEFNKRLAQIKLNLPKGVELNVGRDKSDFVRQSVKDVVETLLISIFLVVLIIFLFFRNWIIALRPLIDIPVSLVGTFFIMYIFGFSINVLSLLGIVLATGLVVDDGIVVTENIFKRIEQGMNKFQAALEGTREIFFAVISTSLTLAIVFIPVIFLQGFTGRLFREFGIVVASAVLISALVSLTLTPVLNVFLGGSASHHSNFYVKSEFFFVGMEKKYRRFLSFFIKNKWISFSILGLCIVIIFALGRNLKSELAPLEDHSYIRTSITTPEGTEYTSTQKIIDNLAKTTMEKFPAAKYTLARYGGGGPGSGVNGGSLMIFLSDPTKRKLSQQEIFKRMGKINDSVPDARVIASQEPTIATSNSRGLPVQFVLQNLDFDKIQAVLPKFMEEAQSSPVFSNVDVDLKFNKPELNITVNRLKATSLGINERDITNALNLAFSGSRYGYFLRNNRQYYVIGQMERQDRNVPADISSMYIRSNSGSMIQLDNLVEMKENSSPPVLYHFNRYKSATVSANLAEGKTLGEGIAEMNRIADKLLDSSFTTALSGPSRDFAESNSNISFALILALLLIYLILAAQFESFRDPFIIMLTVPMAIAGAMLSLWIFGQTLNIFSEIGMILLIGIVTKNGILIVEFANQKRKLGMNKRVAAFESAAARFRPILMTSLATIFGALPIALALGAGSTSRIPLGIVVVGGLCFSLLLTLFVIPIMYIVMSSKNKTNIEE
ncbi:acriflavin resistance protein [Paludibacter propionicigenes WB4]|uniref:Acriflavin resistance protein n=1 Tax=Paludibacter propionicigenes (strain DSM 17365 / JCM 13257 / WB4) TaxID=694427 RepID=E4T1F5_PALPW|nr:efflux RND transporter permease subunit [Paludibacter propionicigenes]ADQ78549.1 acriflavin resistance protein [Paludibacter propionicigenes WB4]